MSESNHTPGPWSYENEGQTVYVGDQIEGQWIAQVRGWGWLQKLKNGEAVQDANGRLIAAAPELLEALKKAQQDVNWMTNSGKLLNRFVFDYIDEAIEKATGGAA